MKKKIRRIIFIIALIIILINNVTLATNEVDEKINNDFYSDTFTQNNDIQDEIDSFVYDLSTQGLNKKILSETVEKYKKISQEYPNNQIADMLEKSVETFGTENINEKSINNINKLLRSFDTENLRKIIDTVDIDKAISQLSEGATILDLVKATANSMTTEQKAGLFASILLSSKFIHTIIVIILGIIIYKFIIRCIIYKKAGKHAWAALIPIYNHVVMLKVCKMNPLWILLVFLPVIGWIILWLVHVASKFMLAESFGKGEWFGLGLWLLWPIFDIVLIASRKTEYIDEIENE